MPCLVSKKYVSVICVRTAVPCTPHGSNRDGKNRTRSYMNGNGKLTETKKVIFDVRYGILTDKRNSYVFFKRMNGNLTLETRHKLV